MLFSIAEKIWGQKKAFATSYSTQKAIQNKLRLRKSFSGELGLNNTLECKEVRE